MKTHNNLIINKHDPEFFLGLWNCLQIQLSKHSVVCKHKKRYYSFMLPTLTNSTMDPSSILLFSRCSFNLSIFHIISYNTGVVETDWWSTGVTHSPVRNLIIKWTVKSTVQFILFSFDLFIFVHQCYEYRPKINHPFEYSAQFEGDSSDNSKPAI